MRFKFDKNGYVCCILYGCSTGDCVEYTGQVPSEPEQYADMDDWANNAQVQAYYLDSKGNLAYDANKASSLASDENLRPYAGILDLVYPVGSIYLSVNYTNPGTLFGGTWERIYNRFLLGAGTDFSVKATGGEKEHTFSTSHRHIPPIGYKSGGAFGVVQINSYTTSGSGKRYRTVDIEHSGDALTDDVTMPYTSTETVSATIPTMPPYFVVCIWQRTA